jgi:flagellar motor switch protein FliM
LQLVPRARILAPPPPRVSDDLKQALVARHERCARDFAADLSALVRRGSQVTLASLVPTTFREFTARLDRSTYLTVLSHALPGPPWLLEISPAILFPVLDGMLGGGAGDPVAPRPLTEIELRLAARVSGSFLNCLREAWKDAVELGTAVERVESHPRRSSAMKPDEAVISSRFALSLGRASGALYLAIPLAVVVLIEPKLTGRPRGACEAPPPEQVPPPAGVELVARLAQSKIAALDAAALCAGDVIATEQPTGAPIAVVQDGTVRFQARAGVVDGRKAIEIQEVVDKPAGAGPSAS